MKHTFLSARNIFVAITLSAAFVAISVPASAKEKKAPISFSAAQPSIKYIGSDKSSSLFLIEMNTNEPVLFQLVVKDADGTELYRQAYETTRFQKYFKLVNEGDAKAMNIQFSLEPIVGGEKITYTAISSSPLNEDVVISKI
jgi:hypothetical protein